MSSENFETHRLLLKPTDEDDAGFIFQLMNSPKWLKYIGDRNIKSVDEAKDYIKNKYLSQLKKLGFANYVMVRKSDQQKIGTCGLYDREGLEGIDIGFALLSEYENQGYAFEANSYLLDLAFNKFGLQEVKAITIKDNLSSQKLLQKLGLKFYDHMTLPGDDEELMVFKIERI